MGNSVPQKMSDSAGKVILSDGSVHKYEAPLTVAELMLEYPQQVVVELQPVAGGKKPVALPADKKLEMNKVYLMLPVRRGKPASLTSDEVRMMLQQSSSILKSKSLVAYTGFVPLFARICVAGSRQGHETKRRPQDCGKVTMGTRKVEAPKLDFFAEILESRPEFLSRQLSGKGWKPSLDPINEKNVKEKIRHWLI